MFPEKLTEKQIKELLESDPPKRSGKPPALFYVYLVIVVAMLIYALVRFSQ
jgi:hypothetical protein